MKTGKNFDSASSMLNQRIRFPESLMSIIGAADIHEEQSRRNVSIKNVPTMDQNETEYTESANSENLKRHTTLKRKVKQNTESNDESLRKSTQIPRFIEAVGLVGRMKTFVVIEIFEGHQIIQFWKCNDLVQHINDIGDNSFKVPRSKEEEELMLKNLKFLHQKVLSSRSLSNSAQESRTTDKLMHNIPDNLDAETNAQKSNQVEIDNNGSYHHHHHYHYHYIPKLDEASRQKKAKLSSNIEISRFKRRYNYRKQSLSQKYLLPSLLQISRLTYRDLRQIFTDGSPVPSIETRRHCIILCLPPLSCVIMADRVFVLVVEDLEMDGLISALQTVQLRHMGFHDELNERLGAEISAPKSLKLCFGDNAVHDSLTTDSTAIEQNSSSNENQNNNEDSLLFPLEFESLELLLSAAFEQLDHDVSYLEEKFKQSIITHKKTSPTAEGGEQLHLLKNQTRAYQNRVDLFDKALNTVVSDSTELANMELTKFKYQQKCYIISKLLQQDREQNSNDNFEIDGVSCMFADKIEDMDYHDPDIEVLIEFFDQEIETFRQRTTRLHERIEGSERLSRFQLALNRNRLLRWDVGSSVLAVVLGLGTTISGIFGMNFNDTYENSKSGFYILCSLIGLITVIGTFIVLLIIRMIRL